MGVVGFRALMIIGLIAGFGGFCAGVTSTDAVNVAKSSKVRFEIIKTDGKGIQITKKNAIPIIPDLL